jgi:hypothetical protein
MSSIRKHIWIAMNVHKVTKGDWLNLMEKEWDHVESHRDDCKPEEMKRFPLPEDGKYPSYCEHSVGFGLPDGLNCTGCGFFVPEEMLKGHKHLVIGVPFE